MPGRLSARKRPASAPAEAAEWDSRRGADSDRFRVPVTSRLRGLRLSWRRTVTPRLRSAPGGALGRRQYPDLRLSYPARREKFRPGEVKGKCGNSQERPEHQGIEPRGMRGPDIRFLREKGATVLTGKPYSAKRRIRLRLPYPVGSSLPRKHRGC